MEEKLSFNETRAFKNSFNYNALVNPYKEEVLNCANHLEATR